MRSTELSIFAQFTQIANGGDLRHAFDGVASRFTCCQYKEGKNSKVTSENAEEGFVKKEQSKEENGRRL